VGRGGIRELERAIDLDLELAACDLLQQVADHRVDPGVLERDGATEEDAAKRVVTRPERPCLDH
jgi:hypothetical protein